MYCGHNNYARWGPPGPERTVAIAVSFRSQDLAEAFAEATEFGHARTELAQEADSVNALDDLGALVRATIPHDGVITRRQLAIHHGSDRSSWQ